MGIPGLATLVRKKDGRLQLALNAPATTGKRLLLDLSVLIFVSKSKYWSSVYEEVWQRDNRGEAADTIFFNPLRTQERITCFLTCIREAGLEPVMYLDGACADARRDQKFATKLRRLTEHTEVVNTLISNNGDWTKETRQFPMSPLFRQVALEALASKNVEIIQCSEEGDARLIRDAEKSPATVFGICANDSDFFLVSERVQYIPLSELERVGKHSLKYRSYNRKVVQKLLNIRPDGLFDIAVYRGCDYTLDLKDEILTALKKSQPSAFNTLKTELGTGLERLCERLNLFPTVLKPPFYTSASSKMKSIINTIVQQANGDNVPNAKLTEQQLCLKEAVEARKIASSIFGFLYDYIVLPYVQIQSAKYPTYQQSRGTLDNAAWLLEGCDQKVKQYLTLSTDGFIKYEPKLKDPAVACPVLLSNMKELNVRPNLPVSLQVSIELEGKTEDEARLEKKKLFDLVRLGIRWNVFDDLMTLDEYPELKTPIAAIRYLSKMEAFGHETPLRALTMAVVFAKYVKQVHTYSRAVATLHHITFVNHFQQVWDAIIYLSEAVFGKRNEKRLEIVENVWSCDASLVGNTDLALYLFTQLQTALPEICKNLAVSDREDEITRVFNLAHGCVRNWKAETIK